MTEHLQQARQSVQQAADATRANVREQLRHVDEALIELESGDKTQPQTPADPDTLETIEAKIVGLIEEVEDPEAHTQLRTARDEIDLHRRARGLSSEE
jgi:predicted FMN-binding regulatory protein PaiB